jgi:SM-20-related protein
MFPKLTNLSEIEKEIEERLALDLSQRGFFFLDTGLDGEALSLFRKEIEDHDGEFQAAKIGRSQQNLERPDIRSDRTRWWDFLSLSDTQQLLEPLFLKVKEVCNRELFLGLSELEGHYAVYEPGAFYREHLDRFQNSSRRTVSLVFFFNNDWKPEEGGTLSLRDLNGKKIDLMPEAGRFVVFLSADIPHEVQVTHRKRLSFAGWWKTRE